MSCKLCPAGSYQDEIGSIRCKRCPLGYYQDEEGQVACKQCPTGAITLLLGSNSIADCGCKAKSINIGGAALECVPCGEGLECPFASSMETLNSGRGNPWEAQAVAHCCTLTFKFGCSGQPSSEHPVSWLKSNSSNRHQAEHEATLRNWLLCKGNLRQFLQCLKGQSCVFGPGRPTPKNPNPKRLLRDRHRSLRNLSVPTS